MSNSPTISAASLPASPRDALAATDQLATIAARGPGCSQRGCHLSPLELHRRRLRREYLNLPRIYRIYAVHLMGDWGWSLEDATRAATVRREGDLNAEWTWRVQQRRDREIALRRVEVTERESDGGEEMGAGLEVESVGPGQHVAAEEASRTAPAGSSG